jgi:hypothetical protein
MEIGSPWLMENRQLEAERSLHNQINILPRGKLITVFIVLALSQLISFSDQNGIGVTLPTIAKDLHAESTISWAGTASHLRNHPAVLGYLTRRSLVVLLIQENGDRPLL